MHEKEYILDGVQVQEVDARQLETDLVRTIPVITIVLLFLTYVGNIWIAIGPCSLWGFFPCLLCPSVLPCVWHLLRYIE